MDNLLSPSHDHRVRIALISDIHANLPALRAMLESFADLNVDRFICLGDTVGYGAEPNECCQLVRQTAWGTVLGNHDAAVAGRMDYSYYYDAAREVLDMHRGLLHPDHLAWLQGLPYVLQIPEVGATFCHGAPVNLEDFEYVFHIEQARRLLPHFGELSPITFIGHSHLTKCYEMTPEEATEVDGSSLELRSDCKYIITAGSVGQPRDCDFRACGGLFDTERRHFQYVRSDYGIETAASAIMSRAQSPTFARRLFFGV